MKGELVLVDECFCESLEFQVEASYQEFSLSIYIDEEKTLEKQLKNRDGFDYCMDEIEKLVYDSDMYREDEDRERKFIRQHFDRILDHVEYIKLDFCETDDREFVKNNPIVLTKKVVLSTSLSITDYDKLVGLLNTYEDCVDRIYVHLDGNSDYVSLLDCYKTMNAIKNQAEGIKKLGLSQMETIMYVYDMVRDRVYTKEDETETSFKSRDLSEVLFGDKIVCVGYANMFRTLLYYLGINCHLVNLQLVDREEGHMRNIIYVNDPKYDIDGVYYFDATWDSKRSNETNEYLRRYRYFAKTRKYMDDDPQYEFVDVFFKYCSKDMIKAAEEIIKSGDYECLKEYCSSVNFMADIIGEPELLRADTILHISPFYGEFDKKKFLRRLRQVYKKFDKPIPGETMVKLFNNVRKIEYYQNSEKYPYTLDAAYETFMYSGWKFAQPHLNEKMRLFQAMGMKMSPKEHFIGYSLEESLADNIERVRFTKVLRNICDERSKNSQ